MSSATVLWTPSRTTLAAPALQCCQIQQSMRRRSGWLFVDSGLKGTLFQVHVFLSTTVDTFCSDRLRAAGSIFHYIVAFQPNVFFLAWWKELYHFKSQIGDTAFCLRCCCHRCNGMWSALGSPASRYPLGMFCQSSSTLRLQQTPHCLD